MPGASCSLRLSVRVVRTSSPHRRMVVANLGSMPPQRRHDRRPLPAPPSPRARLARRSPSPSSWRTGSHRYAHEVAERDVAARTAAGWDRCFVRPEALFAGRPMDERTALELWPAVHERYAERFGVDPEIGRRAYAAHPAT